MNDKELADHLRQKHMNLFGRPADPATLRRWIRQAKKQQQKQEIKTS